MICFDDTKILFQFKCTAIIARFLSYQCSDCFRLFCQPAGWCVYRLVQIGLKIFRRRWEKQKEFDLHNEISDSLSQFKANKISRKRQHLYDVPSCLPHRITDWQILFRTFKNTFAVLHKTFLSRMPCRKIHRWCVHRLLTFNPPIFSCHFHPLLFFHFNVMFCV